MIKSILGVSAIIQNNRTISNIHTYLIEEVGELATEVNIVTGFSNKEPGKDGVVGEAVDAIICLVDLIKVYQPDITEAELHSICNRKLTKWVDSQSEHIKND